MITLLWIIYILVCIFLIGIVLLQPGEAGSLASAFGAASSQTAFGPRGAMNLLQKITAGLAISFMILSVVLSFLMSGREESIIQKGIQTPPKQEHKNEAPNSK